MTQKELALRIRELREKNKLTQGEVAKVLGIKQPAYCALESGDTALTAVAMDKLANFYGMSLDEFLRADQPVLNMHDHASHGYNVIHTQTVNGVGAELFKTICAMLERNSTLLRDIAQQQEKIIELLTKKVK